MAMMNVGYLGVGRATSIDGSAWGVLRACALAATGLLLVGVCGRTVLGQEEHRLDRETHEFVKQGELDPDTPEGKLQAIRKALAQDQPKRALKLVEKWIQRYPNHPLMADALLRKGDALVARKEYFKSLYAYETVINKYKASEQFLPALEREYRIAKRFAGGTKRKLLGLRIVPASGETEEILIRIQERAPGSVLAERASVDLGDFYFSRADMKSAVVAYDMFLQNYPSSQFRRHVLQRLIKANLATFKAPAFDPSRLLDATQWIQQYQREYPAAAERMDTEALLADIAESLARKSYATGQWYQRRGKTLSATRMYQRLVRDHPQTASAKLAIERLRQLGEPVIRSNPTAQPPPTKAAAAGDADARSTVQTHDPVRHVSENKP